jgi:multidrug efflux system membrane fusion protein
VRRLLPAFILLLITAGAVVFIYRDRVFPKPEGELTAESRPRGGGGGGRRGRWAADPNRPVSILAEEVKTANMPVYLYGVGAVQAYNSATVRTQVTGRLIAVEFTEGQTIRKGDVLARIDPATYQAAYDQAVARKAMDEATLANAQADLQRLETLAKSNYSSAQATDAQRAKVAQTEAQVRQDQAQIDASKTDLDRTIIRAPIDGRTGLREVDVGNLVTPADSGGIASITQLQPISVVFSLSESFIGDLNEAQKAGTVALTASVGGKTVGEGTLQVIDNRINQNTGTVRLKGTFANDELALWPGQFVNIRLHLKTIDKATVVSSAAVQQGASGRFVYVVQPEGTVKLTPVEVTQEGESVAVIGKGVQPGERVASSGFANLQDGSKVTVDDGKGEEAPAATATAPSGQEGKGERRRHRRNAPGAANEERRQPGEQTAGQANAAERGAGQAR